MDTSINFKGAFLIKQPTPIIKKSLEPHLGKNGRIFENVVGQGDILCIVDDAQDKVIADFISLTKKIKFRYYQGINPDMKIDFTDKKPMDVAILLSKLSKQVADTKQKLQTLLFSPKKYVEDNSANLKESLSRALNINPDMYSFKNIDGVITITEPITKKVVAKCSVPDKYGISYVINEPGKNEVRQAVRNGEVIFTYSIETKESFKANFDAAAKGKK